MEGRYVKAVIHVLGAIQQAHRFVHWNMQGGARIAVGVDELPIPVPSHDFDIVGVPGRDLLFQKPTKAKEKDRTDEDDENAGPKDLKQGAGAGNRFTVPVIFASIGLNEEERQPCDECEEENPSPEDKLQDAALGSRGSGTPKLNSLVQGQEWIG